MNTLYGEAYNLPVGAGLSAGRSTSGKSRKPSATPAADTAPPGLSARPAARRGGLPYVAVLWNHCIRGQDRAPDDADAYGWDLSTKNFTSLKDRLLPRLVKNSPRC